MRVLVAGATSVLGPPVIRELRARGHEAIGLTRSESKRTGIERLGARATVGDVFDRETLSRVVAKVEPDAVVGLLITLPKRGPMRMSHFRPTLRLWKEGVPNLLDAAAAAGARRLVAESVIFAYGYGDIAAEPVDESRPTEGGAVIRGQQEVLDRLRGMEQTVLEAGGTHGVDGIALRYGVFHGAEVSSTQFTVRMLRRGLLLLPGGKTGLLSWIEIGDGGRATVDALERGRSGEAYNVVDDEPVGFSDYAFELAKALDCRPPRAVPLWLAGLAAPYATTILGRTRLPVSNSKAKRELGWEPAFANYREAARMIALQGRGRADRA